MHALYLVISMKWCQMHTRRQQICRKCFPNRVTTETSVRWLKVGATKMLISAARVSSSMKVEKVILYNFHLPSLFLIARKNTRMETTMRRVLFLKRGLDCYTGATFTRYGLTTWGFKFDEKSHDRLVVFAVLKPAILFTSVAIHSEQGATKLLVPSLIC